MNIYFIALVAPPEIDQQVLKWKLWMKEKYNCEIALRSPAHITLVPPFWMKPELENNLSDSLLAFTATQNSFILQLNNFSNFKPRVIFIDVIPNEELMKLKNGLFQFLLNENKYPLEKDDHSFFPHVTIATRDLHKKAFYDAWEYFKEKKYEAAWPVSNLSLLRHNKKNWDVIITSQFK
jgi:2'-5' RNA ligase